MLELLTQQIDIQHTHKTENSTWAEAGERVDGTAGLRAALPQPHMSAHASCVHE
jgi:hypothetical protein